MYNPVCTYRIQFSADFTFADFVRLIPYLYNLGVKTIYASPVFRAVPGSSHGYDVTDPLTINPEIGTIQEFREIRRRLKSLGMGWIQDIVPNHMAFSLYNPWIADVLEKGKISEFSTYFDIDWQHPDKRLTGKLMLPFLDDSLDNVIRNGEIELIWSNNYFRLKYHGNEFPVSHESYKFISDKIKNELSNDPAGNNKSPLKKTRNNIKSNNIRKGRNASEAMAEEYKTGKNFREALIECVKTINRDPALLSDLIDLQHYVPVHWNETGDVLNYRRFFTINGLICLNMAEKNLFEHYHSLLGKLCKENLIQGIRVDHIDGLYDPHEYLERLRVLAGNDKYIIVEKILAKNEIPEKSWPVQGETGYNFMELAGNLLTRKQNLDAFDREYQTWSRNRGISFNEVLYRKKRFILTGRMNGDLDNLYRCLEESDIQGLRSFQPQKLKAAVGEFLLNCPVYRIYGSPKCLSAHEKEILKNIFEDSLKRSPDLKDELLFLKEIFFEANGIYQNRLFEIDVFFRRCMQFTGPLMAKGGEDTAFYTFNRLIAHNEVGDSPDNFGITQKFFHEAMIVRQKNYPLTLNASATHDTKRGEDARSRLLALSDLPELWSGLTGYWCTVNRKFKKINGKEEIPSPNDEYFIYQTITGFLPEKMLPEKDFEERLANYIRKAFREAGDETGWTDPDPGYENNCIDFIHSIISPGSEFMKSLEPFFKKISYLGVINSLSITLLKFLVPGIPDIYQGSEGRDFNFVDPDNRRAARFKQLSRTLDKFSRTPERASCIRKNLFKPEMKICLIHLLLEQRNRYPDLFGKGEYVPLKLRGKLKEFAIAFARCYSETYFILAIPLHTGTFFDNIQPADFKVIDWKDTCIDIPESFPGEYENLLTGGSLKPDGSISLASVFSEIPFCLMKGEAKTSERKAGILLHITSLPGNWPAGDLGQEAYRFADFLKKSGQRFWQILPLNQVYEQGGYSPYSPLSAFAGNISLINPDQITEEKLICSTPGNTVRLPEKADLKAAEKIKDTVIRLAFSNFKSNSFLLLEKEFEEFRKKERYWLHDYSLFISIKKKFNFSEWHKWPKALRNHDEEALDQFRVENSFDIECEEFAQFIFLRQWKKLKSYCNDTGIRILGDVPVYVNYESSDVWSHPEYFKLGKNRKMLSVGGVPPDYFSKTGQLWKMPVFRWDNIRKDGYL